MKSIKAYLAGPLDLGKDHPNWRAELVKYLEGTRLNMVAFDPSKPYLHSMWGESNNARAEFIEEVNRVALLHSNVMIVSLPRGAQSIGTPIEMKMAHQANIPIILISDIKPGSSVYLDNMVNHENWIPESANDVLKEVSDRVIYIACLPG